MGTNTIRQFIEERIATEFALAPSYPIAFSNAPFIPPNNQTWIRVTILFSDLLYKTLTPPSGTGTGMNGQQGVLTIGVFSPAGQGAAANYAIVDRAVALFARFNESGYVFRSPEGPDLLEISAGTKGTSSKEGLAAAFFQTETSIPFEAYLDS